MSQKNQIEICLATDNRGCVWVAPLLVSVLKNTKSDVQFYILESDLTQENKEKLKASIQRYPKGDIQFISVTETFDFYKDSPWPKQTLYRLMIPGLFPNLNKMIYLDIDTVVYRDIQELWDIDLASNYLAGVWGLDKYGHIFQDGDMYIELQEYFNAGVLLMNLNQMRKDSVSEKMLQFASKHFSVITAADQDLLNIACVGKIKPISTTWNWYISLGRKSTRKLKKLFGAYWTPIPSVIHYYSAFKPNRIFIYPLHPIATVKNYLRQRYFFQCLKETPYVCKKEICVKW